MTNNNTTKAHIQRIHDAAAGIDGKLILASYGQDPKTGENLTPKVQHFNIGDVEGMVNTAKKLGKEEHRNVYTSLAVMRSDLPSTSKGSEEDIIAILGYVADFDDGRGVDYLERCPMKPSYALETSPNNVQCGFLLNQPLLIKDEKDRAFAKQLAQQLTQACTGADNCGVDLSHVWRIPDLPNWPNKKKLEKGRSPAPFMVNVKQAYTKNNVSISELATLPSQEVKNKDYSASQEAEYIKEINVQDLKKSGNDNLVDSITQKYAG